MGVKLPPKNLAIRDQVDPAVQDYAVATGSYDEDLPFLSRALDVGIGGNVRLWLIGTEGTAASGTITFGSISGNVGAVIAGTTVTVAAGDYATAAEAATALAAAINADGTLAGTIVASNTVPLSVPNVNIQGAVTATNIITVWWHNPSPAGDAITLVASGTGVSVSGAVLSGSAGTVLYRNWPSGVEKAKRIRQVIASGTTAGSLVIVR